MIWFAIQVFINFMMTILCKILFSEEFLLGTIHGLFLSIMSDALIQNLLENSLIFRNCLRSAWTTSARPSPSSRLSRRAARSFSKRWPNSRNFLTTPSTSDVIGMFCPKLRFDNKLKLKFETFFLNSRTGKLYFLFRYCLNYNLSKIWRCGQAVLSTKALVHSSQGT